MWIFMNDAFLSIVADPKEPDRLIVRARAKGDIQRVFNRARVTETPHRDYAFRAFIPRKVVAAAISHRLHDITATNFKDSVKEQDRHDAYLSVWSAMMRFQTARSGGDRSSGGKGQGLFRKRQTQRTVWEGLPADNEDDIRDVGMGMPDWEPRKRIREDDDEDRLAWDFMQKQGWVTP